jgi:hypothetical protein
VGLPPPFVIGFALEGETGELEEPGAVTKMFGPPWISWFSNRSIGNEAGTESGDAVTDQGRRHARSPNPNKGRKNEEISVRSKRFKGGGRRRKWNKENKRKATYILPGTLCQPRPTWF